MSHGTPEAMHTPELVGASNERQRINKPLFEVPNDAP